VDAAWVVARESRADEAPAAARMSATMAAFDVPVTVGRDGQVALGVDLPDAGISRVALTVRATPDGWSITNTSRNGVVVHPWGLAPNRAGSTTRLRWPLVAVRVLGGDPEARHWVLLECDAFLGDRAGPGTGRGTTLRAAPPKPLTPGELEAISVVFGQHALAWPPPATPNEPLQLKQAARLLDITASAVKFRLEGARAKAEALGLERQVRVTEPEYVHVLVAAGYLQPPAHRCGA
jgi:hypothetical protein